jgi:Ca-activated chloride channel homolog
MRRVVRTAALILAAALWGLPGADAVAGSDKVDANIVTGLDVSDSISAAETIIQVEGLALAIQSPEVMSAISRGHHKRIGFAVFLWANGEAPVFPAWRMISSPEQARAVGDEMAGRLQDIMSGESRRKLGSLTDVSNAMLFGAEMLRASPFVGDRAILNIIGNGEDNVGEDPRGVRDALVAAGVNINGVVTAGGEPMLEYFREAVIGGPMSFVLPVDSREMLVDVFRRKFVTEIAFAVELSSWD